MLDSNNYLYVFDNNNTYVQHSGGMGSGEHNFKNPKSLTYLKKAIGNRFDLDRIEKFLKVGPDMVKFLDKKSLFIG